MFEIKVDRKIPVPIPIQIRGQIEYGVSYGLLAPGCKLPNVRELAKQLQVSPVTVSQAYQDLQNKHLIVSAPGRGTYVADDVPHRRPQSDRFAELDRVIDQLVGLADHLGMSKIDLITRVSQKRGDDGPASGLSLAFVGEFFPASEAYIQTLSAFLDPKDHIKIFTFRDLERRPGALGALGSFSAILTLAHKTSELADLVPDPPEILGVQFIPSEPTRTALAKINPLARVGLLSTFPEFLAVLKKSVEVYAPHVTIVDTAVIGTERAERLPKICTVIVYATGSEDFLATLDDEVNTIEYRHTPDPTYVVRALIPALEKLRALERASAKSPK